MQCWPWSRRAQLRARGETSEHLGDHVRPERELLADLDGRGVVIDPEKYKGRGHGAGNLCTAENWFEAQTQRITMKTNPER